MRIGISMISNNPKNLEGFAKGLDKFGWMLNNIDLSVVIQSPFDASEPVLDCFDHVLTAPSVKGQVFPFAGYRRASFAIHSHVDYFWLLDDDHRMGEPGGKVFNKSFFDYFSDVFEYLDANNDVGVLDIKGYFGGYASKYDFVTNPKTGIITTENGGIIYKNIGIDKIVPIDDANLVGALEDCLFAFNVISHGYKLVRRYNTPMRAPRCKRIGCGNMSYDKTTIRDNIEGTIRDRWDENWTLESKRMPKGIIKIMESL